MLSRDKRLPLDKRSTSGLQENFFGNQFSTFDSSQNHCQRIHYSTTPGAAGSVPVHIGTGTPFARDEHLNRGTIPMPTCARTPSTISSLMPVDIPQNSMVGQQRQQISELQFENFATPQPFLVWKEDSKAKWLPVLIFHRRPCYGSKKLRWSIHWMIKKTSRSIAGKNFQNFAMLDARFASASNKIIQNSHFKKKVSLEEQKARKRTGFYEEDRSPSWSTTTFELVALMIRYWITLVSSLSLFAMIMLGIQYKMGRSFIIFVKDTVWWCSGKSVQIEDTWDSIWIVRDGDSSKYIDAQLSKIENDGEKKYWSETPIGETLTPDTGKSKHEQWSRVETA